jgi:hypothetical protein
VTPRVSCTILSMRGSLSCYEGTGASSSYHTTSFGVSISYPLQIEEKNPITPTFTHVHLATHAHLQQTEQSHISSHPSQRTPEDRWRFWQLMACVCRREKKTGCCAVGGMRSYRATHALTPSTLNGACTFLSELSLDLIITSHPAHVSFTPSPRACAGQGHTVLLRASLLWPHATHACCAGVTGANACVFWHAVSGLRGRVHGMSDGQVVVRGSPANGSWW